MRWIRHDDRRHELFAAGAEHRPGLRQAQGLGSARPAGSEGQGRGRHAPWGNFPKSASAMVFAFAPPAVIELGHAKGFDFQLQDRGGLGHDKLMAGPQSTARHGRQGPAAGPGPAQRHGGCARIPHRRGLGKGRGAGRAHHRHPQHHLSRLRQRLCQRLHPGRAGQTGVRPGRRPLPHAAQRPGETLRPQHRRQDGSLRLLCLRTLDLRFAETRTLQRAFPPSTSGAKPAPGRSSGEAMAGHGRNGRRKLPQGIGFDWTGLSYQERMATAQAGRFCMPFPFS